MSEVKYHLVYDFDTRGEPPKVFITNSDGVRVEVDELPICQRGGFLDGNGVWQGPWSWEEADWTPGPIAAQLLAVMNAYM